MKTLLILSVAAALQIATFTATAFGRILTPSGDIITKTYNIPDSKFDEISVSHIANVKVVEGKGDIVVNIDSNLAKYLIVSIDDNKLEIGLDHQNGTKGAFIFDVTISYDGQLSKLSASGASQLKSDIVLTGRYLAVKTSGASNIIAMIRGSECKVRSSGASSAEIAGSCELMEIDLSGASKVNAYVNGDQCDIETSGASKLILQGTYEYLFVNSSGASKLSFEGECNRIEIEASGASDIDASELIYESITLDKSGAAKISHREKGAIVISKIDNEVEQAISEMIDQVDAIKIKEIKAEIKEMTERLEKKIDKAIENAKREMRKK